MKKIITISIPKACSEKWENFNHSANGGFCNSCLKTVVDFSGMSDFEIAEYFKFKPAHTCGRFRSDQLKPYIVQTGPKLNPGFTLLKAGLFSLVLLAMTRPTFAQIKPAPATEVAPSTENSKSDAVMEKEFTIKGIVTSSEDGSALPGVNIYLKNSVTTGTVSDADGKFEFPKKLKAGDVLLFSFIGLETQEYVVPADLSEQLDVKLSINMNMACLVTLGAVAVNEVYHEPSAIQKIWIKVKSIF